jgi:hypothetical protein
MIQYSASLEFSTNAAWDANREAGKINRSPP